MACPRRKATRNARVARLATDHVSHVRTRNLAGACGADDGRREDASEGTKRRRETKRDRQLPRLQKISVDRDDAWVKRETPFDWSALTDMGFSDVTKSGAFHGWSFWERTD